MVENQASNMDGEKPWYRKWWGILAIAFGVLVVIGIVAPEDKKEPQQQPVVGNTKSSEQTVSETVTVPFKKVSEDDPNVPRGQQQVVQQGTDGITEVKYKISGTSRTKVSEKVLVAPRDAITKIGTMVQPIELSGNGQQASQKFTLDEGLAVFKLTHSGQSNFGIWLLDSSGARVELLVNEIGSFNGSNAVRINTGGEFVLDVDAGGTWNVRIEQPRPTSASSTPKTLTGHGQQASEFFTLSSGLKTFKMTHSGNSNFGIWLLDSNGERVELLVNEIGAFNGSKAVGITDSGIHVLDIDADGDWSISIE